MTAQLCINDSLDKPSNKALHNSNKLCAHENTKQRKEGTEQTERERERESREGRSIGTEARKRVCKHTKKHRITTTRQITNKSPLINNL